ncbi:MAG: DUF4276 family protein [Clostridiales bacterium]|nr:DUF4276 family protein [Clostridiales bacterium]
MHFEFLIEDQSSRHAMDILLPKLLPDSTTYNIHHYRGIGRIPKNLHPKTDAYKRILLDQLPRLLQGYGHTPNCGYIIVICDLDDRNKKVFLKDLNRVLNACNPKPDTCFCLAIEEFEAWYLGDLAAIKKAYPHVKNNVLSSYVNDSICGTWELLADAIYKGGHNALMKRGRQAAGEQKSVWAKEISPHMDTENNSSPSFNDMLVKLRSIVANAG